MMELRLQKPLEIHGRNAHTIEEAAYAIRQYLIENSYDREGARLVRMLRNVRSLGEIPLAEEALGNWLRAKQMSHP